ncbi:MAG: protein kinase domain-containing protein [Nannocystaceae bacterium]|nr:serine/threonine-protein kinase [bacterium]
MSDSECLDEVTVLAVLDGSLSTEASAQIEEHLDLCDACREFVAEVARTTDAPQESVADRFAPGESCDRYLILHQVGAGGMGVVYAAWDHELDRKVALKVVAPGADARAQARLVREAKAMAAVGHPNVVTVYEVGRAEAGVYIAMEYLEGGTLRHWLDGRAPWREVVSMFVRAGRGLAAAHAAGVVHRDFKPDNVLLGGSRPCVVDFGLAREAPSPGHGRARRGETTPAGTPAYMAPEQRDALTPGPAADQYAFAAALWEGLFGVLPSSGRAGDGAGVPRRLRKVLERALEQDPEDRFVSVEALLGALERAARRRPWPMLAAALVVGVGVAAGAAARPRTCANVGARWRDAWGPEARAQVQERFRATNAPHAAAAYERFQEQFERYTAGWVDAAAEVCAHPDRPRAALRRRCLDARQTRAIALLDGLEGLTADQVELAVTSVFELPPVTDCEDPRDMPDSEALTHALEGLDQAEVLLGLQSPAFPEHLEALGEHVERLGDPGLRARLAYLDGMRLRGAGSPEDAAQRLRDSARLALEAEQPRVLFNAASELAMVEGQLQRFEWAEHWLDVLDALAAQMGERTWMSAHAWAQRGFVHRLRGEQGLARDALRRAVELEDTPGSGDATTRAHHRRQLASVLSKLGEHEEAMRLMRQSLDETASLYGEDSPQYAEVLGNLATAHHDAGDLDASIGTWDESVRILSSALGQDDYRTMVARAERAVVLLSLEPQRSGPELEAALEAFGGAASRRPITFILRDAIGRAHARTGSHDAAVEQWTTLLAEMGASEATEIGMRVHLELGRELGSAGRLSDASEHLGRAAELAADSEDPASPWLHIVRVAQASLLQGPDDEHLVEEALQAYARLGYRGVETAYAKFVLAQVLGARGEARERVVALLDEACTIAHLFDRPLEERINAWRRSNVGNRSSLRSPR